MLAVSLKEGPIEENENVPWVFAGCVVIRDEMPSNHEINFL